MVAPIKDFKLFATGGGANVVDQPTYAAAAYVPAGRGSGILPSNVYNKIARQGSVGMALLQEYIVAQTGQDVLDNGDLAALLAQFTLAVQGGGNIRPNRIVTSSALLNLAATDFYVGFNRTAGLLAQVVNLPASNTVVNGQEIVLDDLAGNFDTYPLTVTPPGGVTIAGLNTFVLNVKRAAGRFRKYSDTLWSAGS